MSILEKHIHMPDAKPKQPHRLVALDGTHIRCIDCCHTLDVGNLAGVVARSTSTSSAPLNINDQAACPEHLGQFAHSCSGCRSEQIAGDQ